MDSPGSEVRHCQPSEGRLPSGAGRVRCRQKLRNDHRIAAALESLLIQLNGGKSVPIAKVMTNFPVLAFATSAGPNSIVLGSLAKTSIR